MTNGTETHLEQSKLGFRGWFGSCCSSPTLVLKVLVYWMYYCNKENEGHAGLINSLFSSHSHWALETIWVLQELASQNGLCGHLASQIRLPVTLIVQTRAPTPESPGWVLCSPNSLQTTGIDWVQSNIHYRHLKTTFAATILCFLLFYFYECKLVETNVFDTD